MWAAALHNHTVLITTIWAAIKIHTTCKITLTRQLPHRRGERGSDLVQATVTCVFLFSRCAALHKQLWLLLISMKGNLIKHESLTHCYECRHQCFCCAAGWSFTAQVCILNRQPTGNAFCHVAGWASSVRDLLLTMSKISFLMYLLMFGVYLLLFLWLYLFKSKDATEHYARKTRPSCSSNRCQNEKWTQTWMTLWARRLIQHIWFSRKKLWI